MASSEGGLMNFINNFINNIKMRDKLIVMLIIPIVALLYLSIPKILNETTFSKEMKKVETLTGLTTRISTLVHELQKERAFTVMFLDSKGKRFIPELSEQRSNTDQKITDLRDFLKGFDINNYRVEFKNAMDNALNHLDNIKEKREAANEMAISAGGIIDYYANMNTSFLDVIAHISKLSINVEISTMTSAYVNFLLGKEKAGIERAVLTDTFSKNRFAAGMFSRFNSIVAAQDTYMNVFLFFATAEQRDFYKSKMQGTFVDEAARMRNIAFEKADKGGFGVDAAHWIKMVTGKINLLKEVEDRLSNDLTIKATQLRSKARSELIFLILITITSILVVITLAYFFIQGITRPLNNMVESSQKIASGNLTTNIKIHSKGEIGIMANFFKEMAGNLREMLKKIKGLSENVDTLVKRIEESASSVKRGSEEQAMAMRDISAPTEWIHEISKDIARGMEQLLRLSEDTSFSILEMAVSVDEIDRNVADLTSGIGDISTSIEEISRALKDVASGVESISQDADGTAASLIQIDASAMEIERHTRETAEMSNEMAREGDKGVKAVQLTHEGMKKVKESVNALAMVISELGKKSKEIGKILNVIDDLTADTNLLALNASILAAQAGEHGKGFSVVADAMRELSGRTAVSTREITAIISGTQGQIEKAVASAGEGLAKVMEGEKLSMETIGIFKGIMERFEAFQVMSLKIAKATQEQARGSKQVTQNLGAITSTIHHMVRATEEQSGSSTQIGMAVEQMNELVLLIKKATAEQAGNGKIIASNTEKVMKSVQEMDTVSSDQEKESQRIAAAVMETAAIADAGLKNAGEIEKVVEMLKKEVFTLREGLERFKMD